MRALAALVGLLLLAAPSGAQQVKESTVSGTLVSRSVTIPAGETAAEVFTVPSGTTFVMTQACGSPPSSNVIIWQPIPPAVSLIGSELGVVPVLSCFSSFQPGIAFGAEERISCQLSNATSVDVSCLVTGVLQPERPRGHGPPWNR